VRRQARDRETGGRSKDLLRAGKLIGGLLCIGLWIYGAALLMWNAPRSWPGEAWWLLALITHFGLWMVLPLPLAAGLAMATGRYALSTVIRVALLGWVYEKSRERRLRSGCCDATRRAYGAGYRPFVGAAWYPGLWN